MVQKRLSEAAKKRLRAGRMLQKGKGCADVALAVGVARQTVYTWKALLDEGGIDALRAVPERGRPAQLDQAQLASVGAALLQSPTEHGFGTELWTIKRMGAVIKRMHGVRFSQAYVWRILGSLGFSPKSRTSAPSSATKAPCAAGNAALGRRLKKSPARRPTDRLCGRVGHQRAPYARAHLGAQGADADHPVPFQLDSRVGHRRTDTHELSVQIARRQHQEGRDRPIPQGAQGPFAAAIAGHLGWLESAQKPLGARLPGHFERAHPDRFPSTLRTRSQPGRIPVGLAQTACAGQLLPERSERAAHYCAKQTQKRPEASIDHRRLLGAGYALVMS